LRVRDRGPGFALAEANLPSDVMSESGRGLFLVRAFAADPIVVPRPDGGTEVVITLPLEVVA
jgi:anti-sigma regulatory factor (Ser/Thr protein kinase)